MDLNTQITTLSKNLDFGTHKLKCPACQHTRTKHKHDTPLSLSVSSECSLYRCHHCGIEGKIWDKDDKIFFKQLNTKIYESNDDNDVARKWLASRGISDEVMNHFGIIFSTHKFNGSGEIPSVGFPYKKQGVTYAIKWRSASDEHKYFTQTKGGAKTFYNLPEKLNGEKRIIICEGEMDVLSLATAGIGFGKDDHTLVVSVPNGAPAKVSETSYDDKKYAYIRDAQKILLNIDQSILLTDADSAGENLKETLSRRIGKAKCFEVDFAQYKDANEVLMTQGVTGIQDAIENATPLPLAGLNNISVYQDKIQTLYDKGYSEGLRIGLPSFDRLISFNPSNLFVITGYPSSGKSELADEICIRLAKQGWNICMASFEKPPQLHALQLASKITGKPFFKSSKHERMSQEELDFALEFIDKHFIFQDHQAGSPFTIEGILDFASSGILRDGNQRVLVIDPFNFIDLKQGKMMMTDAINRLLTSVTQWAKSTGSVVLFIAHPAKPQDYGNKVPSGLQISGSISWYTKADFLLSIVRNDNDVSIHVLKVRWNFQGEQGIAKLRYNEVCGRFEEISGDSTFDQSYEWSTDF